MIWHEKSILLLQYILKRHVIGFGEAAKQAEK
jgi:hypothetical protein